MATAAVVLMAIAEWLLYLLIDEPIVVSVFYVAVSISAWYGGLRLGLFTIGLSLLAALLITTLGLSVPISAAMLVRAGLFIAVGTFISFLVDRLQSARRQAEEAAIQANNYRQAVRQGEEYSRLAIERIEDYAIFTLDPLGCIISWNIGVKRVLGYDESEWLGQPGAMIFPTDEAAPAAAKELREAETRGYALNDRWLVKSDGTRFWASGTTTAFRDEQGTLLGFIKVLRDLTERKLAEEELQRREDQLRLVIDALPVLIAYVDAQLHYRFANKAYLNWFGTAPEQVRGRHVVEFIGEAAYQRVRPRIDAAMAGQTVEYEATVPYALGGTRAVRTMLVPHVVNGNVEGLVALVEDMSERKRHEEHHRFLAEAGAVLASSLDYRTTLDRVARLVIPNLADYCIIDIVQEEDTIQRLVTASIDPAVEALVAELRRFPPDLDKDDGVSKVLRMGKPEVVLNMTDEYLQRVAHNAEHLRILRQLGVRTSMAVPLMGRGRIFGALTFVATRSRRPYDAADVELAEELARRAAMAVDNARLYRESQNALAARDQFLAMLSHELRTPLTPVLLTVSLLESRSDLPADLREDIETIHRSVQLEARLIDDLLDLTRIARGKMQLQFETVDAHLVIRRAVELSCRNQPQQVTLELNAVRHHVHADPARLQQVLWNLLINAVKFTPPTGRITVRTLNVDGERLRIEVSDTGVGIDPAALPRIFNAFEQERNTSARESGGLGLGLAISRRVMDMHGGSLQAHSPGKGKGATFVVELATVPELAVEPVERLPSAQQMGEPQALRILLVEDNESTLHVLSRLLTSLGHTVHAAATAQAALDAAQQEQFDLVISDLGLPDRDGYDLMRTLRERYDMTGVALSGYGMEEDIRKSKDAGFIEHITKPVDLNLLQSVVNRAAQPENRRG